MLSKLTRILIQPRVLFLVLALASKYFLRKRKNGNVSKVLFNFTMNENVRGREGGEEHVGNFSYFPGGGGYSNNDL